MEILIQINKLPHLSPEQRASEPKWDCLIVNTANQASSHTVAQSQLPYIIQEVDDIKPQEICFRLSEQEKNLALKKSISPRVAVIPMHFFFEEIILILELPTLRDRSLNFST